MHERYPTREVFELGGQAILATALKTRGEENPANGQK